jgi:hypothetical protein
MAVLYTLAINYKRVNVIGAEDAGKSIVGREI